MSAWRLAYEGFDPADEGLRETLCTLGNGSFATRGAAPEAEAGDVHYPGTYLAGGYNRLVTDVAGRAVENEDLVNLPNWLPLSFRPAGGEWLGLAAAEVLEHRLELDLRAGVLERFTRVRDAGGRTTALTQRRLVHMGQPHLAALETTLVAEDWSGPVEILSALDGTVRNTGVPRYRELSDTHLAPLHQAVEDDGTLLLVVETNQSHVRIAEAARTQVFAASAPGGEAAGERESAERAAAEREPVVRAGYAGELIRTELAQGRPLRIEKVIALATSRDHAVSSPDTAVAEELRAAGDFAELLAGHSLAWQHLWRRWPVETDDDHVSLVLRLHLFHLLQTASPHTADLDAGMPARGLHGEAYRGHVFWDEVYILPLLTLAMPDVTRALLLYRCRRLPAARRAAREAGYRGAMYPWQSGSDGREETQTMHLNPRSGRWLPDDSHLQRHVALAIAYNVLHYAQATGDDGFLRGHGAEMVLEIARFLGSLTSFSEEKGRYEIRGVMGPDEYHDRYPGAEQPGLHNNAYTNVMTSWVLARALELLDELPDELRYELLERLGVHPDELELLDDVSRRLYLPYHDGILSQFEGYGDLEEFDWEGYRTKYGDIHRLDRILEAEGDTTNRYKLAKQADTLMLYYLLSADELAEVFARLGYPFDPASIPETVRYYERRTSHGSTLSRVVHAWVLAGIDPDASWAHFVDALDSDVNDIQGGTTREGIHTGVMAGTVDLVQRCYMGLRVRAGELTLDPQLPAALGSVSYAVAVAGAWVDIVCTRNALRVAARDTHSGAVLVRIRGERHELAPGESVQVPLGEGRTERDERRGMSGEGWTARDGRNG